MSNRPKLRRVRTLLMICLFPMLFMAALLLLSGTTARTVTAQRSGDEILPMSEDPVWISKSTDSVTDMAWGDVDNNGYLDLVVATKPNSNETPTPNRLYLNHGGKLSSSADWFSQPNRSNSVFLADINRDGWIDLIVGNDGKDELYLNEQGKLTDSPGWRSGAESATSRLAVGDIDGDGWYDLVAGHLASENDDGSDKVYRNLQNHSIPFFAEDGELLAESEGNTIDLALADADGDGYLDLLSISQDKLRLYRAEDQEGMILVGTCHTGGAFTHERVEWGPVNDGSALQLVIAGIDTWENYRRFVAPIPFAELIASANQSTCDYEWESRRHIGTSQTLDPEWVDVNGDGLLDLATARHVLLARNESDEFAFVDIPCRDCSVASKWADVDGDGDLDVIVYDSDQLLKLYRNESSLWQLSSDLEGSGYIWGDIDNDGLIDRVGGIQWDRVDMQSNDGASLTSTQSITSVPDLWSTNVYWRRQATDLRSYAFGDLDGDRFVDLAIGTTDAPVQVHLNSGNGVFEPNPIWTSDSDHRIATVALAWGDVNGDGHLDLAVGSDGSGLDVDYDDLVDLQGDESRDKVFLFDAEANTLESTPSWQSTEIRRTETIRWIDIDQDGDLDLIAADVQGPFVRMYANNEGILTPTAVEFQAELSSSFATVNLFEEFGAYRLNPNGSAEQFNYYPANPSFAGAPPLRVTIFNRNAIEDVYSAQTDPPSLSRYYDEGAITFQYEINGAEEWAYDAIGFYSIDGGSTWLPATPTDNTIWQQLQPGEHEFVWKFATDGLVGRNDDVRFRLQAQPRARLDPLPNTIPGLFQQPFVQAETLPFRVLGKQVRVVETFDGSEEGVAKAVVYQLPTNGQSALLMGNALSGEAYVTDRAGYLSGRGRIPEGDMLFATLPVSQAYRIPPQLLFDANAEAVTVDTLKRSPTAMIKALDALSAEMWLYPTSDAATLIALGADTHLSYQTISGTTTISLTVAGETTSTDAVTLQDGSPHHLAFSWSSESGAAILYADGEPVVTSTTTMTATVPLTHVVIGDGFEGTFDEIRLWDTVRRPITETVFAGNRAFATSGDTLLTSEAFSEEDATHLIGYWPITGEDGQTVSDHSGNGNDLQLPPDVTVAFKPLYTLYHTSGAITNTAVTSSTNGVLFTPVTAGGIQTLTVSADNPLILFDLDVSLEWDARNDTLFLQQLEQSFQDASALLYDITDGQIALGQINLFHDKLYWGSADIVIRADNSLRPSAAIGGVVNLPVDDPGNEAEGKPPYEDAYAPGQIRMGDVMGSVRREHR